MAEDKVSSLGTIAWYLSARDGYLSARVHPGMRLGEDAGGELSLRAEDALIELEIDDGRLVVRVVADSHELVVPGRGSLRDVSVSPQTQVQISFTSNTLSVDTNFATDNPFSDSLEIQVVPVVVADEQGGSRVAMGPATAKPRPPAEPVEAVPEADEEADDADSGAEALPSPHADAVEAQGGAADSEIALAEPGHAEPPLRTPVERLQREHAATAADRRAERLAAFSQLRSSLASRAGPLFIVAVLVGFVLLFLQSQADRPARSAVTADPATEEPDPAADSGAPVAADSEPLAVAAQAPEPAPAATESSAAPAVAQTPDAPAPGATLGPESTALLANVALLLAAEELPNKPTIDFALQSLKALRAAYPNDAGVRESLERFTERLASEAKQSFDRGDAIMAGRLIEQASATGVAPETVASAFAYFEAASGDGGADEAEVVAADGGAESLAAGEGDGVADDGSAQAELAAEPAGDAGADGTGQGSEAQGVADAAPAEQMPPSVEASSAPENPGAGDDDARLDGGVDDELDALVARAEQEELPAGAAEAAVTGSGSAAAETAEAAAEALDLEGEADAAASQPPLAGEAIDPLAPGPEYTGEVTDGDLVAFTSVVADPELDAVLAEALGMVEQVPETAPAADGAPQLYPFADLRAIRLDPPDYPRRALPGAEASVDIEMTVSETGHVRDVEVRGDPPRLFSRAATRAVSGWVFEPVVENGKAVPVRTQVRLTFRG